MFEFVYHMHIMCSYDIVHRTIIDYMQGADWFVRLSILGDSVS